MRASIAPRLWLGLLTLAAAAADATAQAVGPHFYNGVEVVCIGIDKYASDGVGKLSQAAADARKVAAAFEKHFGTGPAQLLLDDKAKKQAILAALDEIDGRPRPPEAVILFFAGHGLSFETTAGGTDPRRVGYLVPQDAKVDLFDTSRPDEWEKEAIDMRGLVERVKTMKSRHVVLIADACCSGFLTKRGGLESQEVVALLTDPSRTVLAATTQRQAAQEGAKGGVFSTALVAALEGAAKDASALSVTDLFQRVRDQVSKDSKGAMTPQMSHVGAGDGEFVFIPRSIPDGEVASLKEAVADAKQGKPLDVSKLTALRGTLDAKKELQGRRTTLADVCRAQEALDYRFSANPEPERTKWEGLKRRLERNAALGDVMAMAGLHYCYQKGLGTDPSPDLAYHWARQAAEFEKPAGVGSYLLGRCYLIGLGVAKNPAAAQRLFEDSEKKGFLLGELMCANNRLASGTPTAAQISQARRSYEKGVKLDVPRAAFWLAQTHVNLGNRLPGVRPDYPAALKLFTRAADQGCTVAMFAAFELMSCDVPGLRRDVPAAKQYLQMAADAGLPLALYQLAGEYCDKPGNHIRRLELKPDLTTSRALLERAAKQKGSDAAPAKSFLSQFYEYGWAGEQDRAAAVRLCEEAAKDNEAYAHYIRGRWFTTGKMGYKRDFASAAEAYARAADQNLPAACLMAAQCYEVADKEGHWMQIVHYTVKGISLGGKLEGTDNDNLFATRVKKYLLNEDLRQTVLAKAHPDTAAYLRKHAPTIFTK